MLEQRQFIHLQGSLDWCHSVSEQLLQSIELENNAIAYGINFKQDRIKIREVDRLKKRAEIEHSLGQQNSALIFNAYAGFNPDLFAALCGLIESPGMIILLSPAADGWQKFDDPDYSKICSYPATTDQIKGRFIGYFLNVWAQYQHHDNFQSLNENENTAGKLAQLNSNIKGYFLNTKKQSADPVTLTQTQQLAFDAINLLINTNDQNLLFLIGHRGRGKSITIAQALASILCDKPQLDYAVVSNTRSNIAVIEKQLEKQLGQAINFYPPDEYLRLMRNPTLLIIEEAASISLSVLNQLIKTADKAVLATTTDGYEGSGQGLLLKFAKQLDPQRTMQTITLDQALRWSKNDLVEQFLQQLFCLDQTVHIPCQQTRSLAELEYQKIDRDELVCDTALSQQIFKLYSTAHYRTTPDDLRFLLDAPEVSLWVATSQKQIVCAALIIKEGNIPNELERDIWLGKRRLSGHLIAQALSNQCGFKHAVEYGFYRISRIATAKHHRRLGIASKLIQRIETDLRTSQSRLDFLAVSFGFEASNYNFWQKLNFKAVKIGLKENARSGQRSIIMLKALSTKAEQLKDLLEQQFKSELAYFQQDLPSAIQAHIATPENIQSPNWHQIEQDVFSFAFGHRQYLNCDWQLALAAERYLSQQDTNAIDKEVLLKINPFLEAITDKDHRRRYLKQNNKKARTQELRRQAQLLYNLVWGNKS